MNYLFSSKHFVLQAVNNVTHVKSIEYLVMNTHTCSHTHRQAHTQRYRYMFKQLTGFHLAAAASKRLCQSCCTIIIWRMLSMTVISYLLIPHLNLVSFNPGIYSKSISTIYKAERLSAMRNTVVNDFCYLLFSLLLSVLQMIANSLLSKNSTVCKDTIKAHTKTLFPPKNLSYHICWAVFSYFV